MRTERLTYHHFGVQRTFSKGVRSAPDRRMVPVATSLPQSMTNALSWD